METFFPESLLRLIGEFVISFPRDMSNYEQAQVKKRFAHKLACFYSEYIELLIDSNSIPYFSDLKQVYKNEKDSLFKEAESKIREYNLGIYRDVIMENYVLTIPNLITISEYVYKETNKDINKTCAVYCQLGYPLYENRDGNEDYLINLINSWTNFASKKGLTKNQAQFLLLNNFVELDTKDEGWGICDLSKKQWIWSFFPYSVSNVENLVDFIVKNDSFNSPFEFFTDIDTYVNKDNSNNSELYSKAITSTKLCRYIVSNILNDSLCSIIASNLHLSSTSNEEEIIKAANILDKRLKYYTILPGDNISNIQNEKVFIKFVNTSLPDVDVVRLETDIEKLLMMFPHNEEQHSTMLKLNSMVSYENEEFVEAENAYRFGDKSYDDVPYHALLCNFYTYIFNKANDHTPFPLFKICTYIKWLGINLEMLKRFIPELSNDEIESLILDYALDSYSSSRPFENDSLSSLARSLITFLSYDEEEMIDLIYDVREKRSISNYELVDFWKYLVLDKQFGYSKGKTFESQNYLKVALQEYPENGKFLLPWKYVRYVNNKAFFYHPNHEKGPNAILPYIYITDKASRDFSELGNKILWSFPDIECVTKNGKIINIDEQYADYVISSVAYIYKVYDRRKKVSSVNEGLTAKDVLIKYKSEQLSFLEKKQLKYYPIIPIGEKVYTSGMYREEPSLLFTIGKTLNEVVLTYENTSISRASYIFIVQRTQLESVITKIKDFFSCEKPNKRSELQFSRDMFFQSDGFLRVIRVIHDDIDNWKNTINFYAKFPKE